MTNTIGNPISWGLRVLAGAGHGLGNAARELRGEPLATPVVMDIDAEDIGAALRLGLADFMALRTDVIALCLLYPVIGGILVWSAYHHNFLPLIFPLISGFALIGPAAAVGLYEMSRRREAGQTVSWADGFSVYQSPRFAAILVLALGLLTIFLFWMITAYWIFAATIGPVVPASPADFAREVLTTGPGWAMILLGIPAGFGFAVLVLATSIVSFPLLLDRNVGLPVAVITSLAVVKTNPVASAVWGLTVAMLLVIGSLPFLMGLAVVLPILGHASWHLYRRAVVPG